MRMMAAILVALCASAEGDIPALGWEARSDWVDVRELGAEGDGVADDTEAIQAALDGVTNGTTVYLPAGTYRVTETLTLTGPLIGVAVIGHGRETRLVWDGEEGGKLLVDDGVAYSRYVGLTFEGGGTAAVGFFHHSDNRFETEVQHRHLAFRGFTDSGILADHQDSYALAETVFENCLFEDCGRGVGFVSFNDYNYTFDGCEFRRCGVGIDCSHGNYYARDTHFEGSATVDIRSAPEHACSVRRCTSVGSAAFIQHGNSVSPISIQDCQVAGWTGANGAVTIASAPALMFDCGFSEPPDNGPAVRLPRGGQRLIVSGNSPGALLGNQGQTAISAVGGAEAKVGARNGVSPEFPNARVYEVPEGERQGSLRDARESFLRDEAEVPTQVFDVKQDFGAVGDGKADDTAATRAAVEAARNQGKGAIAYLPTGTYAISETIEVTGSDYTVGGTGFLTRVRWAGPEGGTVFRVRGTTNVTLENLTIGHHDGGQATNAIDIHHVGSGGESSMVYDGVFVYGMYQKQPFRQGLRFEDLGPEETVIMRHVQGNLRFIDCARATILGNATYEGSVVVEGTDERRDGFLGFMTRLATLTTHGLYLRDNQSIVMSDFYVEQADNGFVFEGSEGTPPGRATIGGAKLHFTIDEERPDDGTAMTIRDYAGQVFFGPDQFYVEPTDAAIRHEGSSPFDLFVLGNCFYRTRLDVRKGTSARVYLVGNESVGVIEEDTAEPAAWEAEDVTEDDTLAQLTRALDDLRRLGEVDLRLNHPDRASGRQ